MLTVTKFDQTLRYIYMRIFITGKDGKLQNLLALLDTGAPITEFSDETLQFAGLLMETKDVSLKQGFQTQKYGKAVIPQIEICSHPINNLEVYVSHFDKSWGIDALIGLDFFRRFRTTIDYSKGILATEPYEEERSEA